MEGWVLQCPEDTEKGGKAELLVTWYQISQSPAVLSRVVRTSGHVTMPVTHVGTQRAPFFVLG